MGLDGHSTVDLLQAVIKLQGRLIAGCDGSQSFAEALDLYLDLTDSSYGFIAEVNRTETGKPHLTTQAFRRLGDDQSIAPGSEPAGLESLIAEILDTQRIAIVNLPRDLPRRELAIGHSPGLAFLGIPLLVGGELLGMVGVANRPGGYDEELARSLEPLTTACGQLIAAARDRRRKEESQRELRLSEERLRLAAEAAQLGTFSIDLPSRAVHWSPELKRILGGSAWTPRDVDDIARMIHKEDASRLRQSFERSLDPRGDGVFCGEYRVVRGDEVCWLMIQGRTRFEGADVARLPVLATGVVSDVTQRKRTEEALKESQSILQKAQAVGQVGSWISDPADRGRLEWSDETCRIFGVAPADFDGRVESFFRLVYPQDLPAVQEASRAALAGKREYAIAHRIIRPDGAIRWVFQQADVERDSRGAPVRMVGIVRDITERKQVEDALRESEARLQTVVRGMPVMMDALDDSGMIVAWNDECERVTGYKAAEIIGNPRALELLYPDRAYREAMMAEWGRRGGNYLNWEWDLTCKDGSVRTIAWSNISMKLPIAGWSTWGIGVDVTERKRATEALRESEERFRSLVEHGFDGINVVDALGTILYASPAAARTLGYTAEELLGLNGFSFVHPDDVERMLGLMGKLLLDPMEIHTPTLRLRHKNGEWRWVEATARNLLDHPATRGVVVNWRDITERKLAEDKLAIQQAELLHAARLSTMGQMVATMSHEISQPLSALSNYSAACSAMLQAQRPSDPEKLRGYVQEISRQTQRAGSIVKRLRAFGSKTTPEQDLCDLNWLLKDSVELVASDLRRNGVTVEWDLPESSLRLPVDRIQFQQVMVNLLTNACDAMLSVEPAAKILSIRCRAEPGCAVVEVQDQGIGLSETVMQHLYQPFFSTKPDGMGLGLSICQSILEGHGGTIEAMNSEPGGAIFRLRLPLNGASGPVVHRSHELQSPHPNRTGQDQPLESTAESDPAA
ncbi:MAG TPA: PAS domain S-box protein [Pirellulaceae bacterium]|nr:PAS domain S-box protein [Pirellulaceae bacterium]